MGKIKITLDSGSVLEKPLITCFKGTNGDYVVFDNEANGSMGLPIICISKFLGNKVEKIFDQNEWAAVKENLKTIIGGTALPYISVPENITAAADFFTQLTLPVASFELLKNTYAPPAVETPAPAVETPAEPVVSENLVESAPSVEQAPAPTALGSLPEVAPVAPVEPPVEVSPVVPDIPAVPIAEEPVAPAEVESIPSVEVPTDLPAVPDIAINDTAPVEIPPVVETTSVTGVMTDTIDSSALDSDLQTIKDNFMKACETMFDALIKKFESK